MYSLIINTLLNAFGGKLYSVTGFERGQDGSTIEGTVAKIDIKEFIVGTFLKIKKCLFINSNYAAKLNN